MSSRPRRLFGSGWVARLLTGPTPWSTATGCEAVLPRLTPNPGTGQHPWYQKRGGVVERIGRKLEHDQALREFYERGGYLSGLEGRGFRVNSLPGDDWPEAP